MTVVVSSARRCFFVDGKMMKQIDELSVLGELTCSLQSAQSWEEQVASLLKAIAPFEYDTYVIGVLPTLQRSVHSAPVLFENMNKDWIKEHDENNFGLNASVKHCLINNEPLLWSKMSKDAQAGSDEMEKLINSRVLNYYVGGFTIPLWTHWCPFRFGMSLTSSKKIDFESHDKTYHLYQTTLVMICRLFFSYANWRENLIDRFDLSVQSRQVIEAILLGKSRKQVASEMKISEHTVKYYLRTTATKFGVKTAEQAILHYSMLGLMDFNRLPS